MKRFFSALTLLAALFLVGCSQASPTSNKTETSSTQVSDQVKIQIKVAPKDADESIDKKVTVNKKDSLMKILKENFKIEEKNGMTTSIDGHAQDEAAGLYWMYTVNDEMAPKGAAETYVKDGDVIEFYQEVYQ